MLKEFQDFTDMFAVDYNSIKDEIEVPDYPNAVHHIVAGNSPQAAEAREEFENGMYENTATRF